MIGSLLVPFKYCGATREGCFFTKNSCSLTKGVVNYHKISWCCFCVKIYSYFNTFSLEQLIVTSQTDVLAYANKIDARKMRNWSPAIVKRTSVQKSNKNDIFMARVKNSNCLNFCTQVDPSKTRKAVYFFPQMYFNFRGKRTFRFHPLESMNRVITGRKLNTFARFAFQRYYV